MFYLISPNEIVISANYVYGNTKNNIKLSYFWTFHYSDVSVNRLPTKPMSTKLAWLETFDFIGL